MSPSDRASVVPVGATLDRGFALLGRQPRALVVPALALHLVPMVAVLLLTLVGVLLLGDIDTTTDQVRESTFFGDSTLEDREIASLTDGQWATFGILAAIAGVTMLWFSVAAYASMIFAARRADVGEARLPFGAALRESLRAAPRLFGLSLVVLVAAAVALVVAWFVARTLNRAGGLSVMGMGGAVGLAVLGVIAIRLLLFPVVALVEDRGLSAFGRSWRLTAGRFWPLLGLTLLLAIVVTAVYVVATLLLEALFGVLNAFDTAFGSWLLLPYTGLLLLLSVVAAAAFLAPLVVAYRSVTDADGSGSVGGAGPAADDRAPVARSA